MANDCPVVLQACAIRVARLDGSGVPLPGANNLYVSDGMIELTYTEELERGIDIVQKNACDNLCAVHKGPDLLKRVTLAMQICPHDPELFELLRGGSVLTSGGDKGYAAPAIGVDPQPNGVSLEVWCKREINGSPAGKPYEWFVFPRTKWAFGAQKIENGFKIGVLEGFGIENANWYNGPSNNWPVASTRCYQSMPTSYFPVVQCGYQTLAAS